MKKLIIGIQGDAGSTNERACHFFAKKHRWDQFEIKYLISTKNVLKALSNSQIDLGTFAWESSRAGLVEETRKAIIDFSYKKIDEVTLPLDHALLTKDEIDLAKNINIYSHPQALKEHKNFLTQQFNKINLIPEIDTAIAAKKLKNQEYQSNSMIIAPISCAKIYNLEVFMADLPTNQGYETTIYLAKKL